MRTSWTVAACLLAAASAAPASTLGFSGNFSQDSDVELFYYTVQNTGLVTVSTTSFAGGGFSPILSLFNSAGVFQFDNSGYGGNTEATISWNSLAEELYIVALTQYDNYAVGPDLADGFVYDGMGNFTAEPPFNPPIPGGSFLLPGPEQRTSAWAVEFTSADPTLEAAEIPEPSTVFTGVAGVLAIAARLATRRRKTRS